jgi:hypothetical protein
MLETKYKIAYHSTVIAIADLCPINANERAVRFASARRFPFQEAVSSDVDLTIGPAWASPQALS